MNFFEDVDTFVQIVDSESKQNGTFSELPLALGRSLIQEEITYTFIHYIHIYAFCTNISFLIMSEKGFESTI